MIGRFDGSYGDINIFPSEKQNWYVHWGWWKDQILEAVEILVFLRDVLIIKKNHFCTKATCRVNKDGRRRVNTSRRDLQTGPYFIITLSGWVRYEELCRSRSVYPPRPKSLFQAIILTLIIKENKIIPIKKLGFRVYTMVSRGSFLMEFIITMKN